MSCNFRIVLTITLLCTMISLSHQAAADLVVPFTESFAAGNSGWVAQTNTTPAWSATGGVEGDGFISMNQTIGVGGFGAIIFRGNNGNNASQGAFVGDWLDAGVAYFSAYVRHDAPEPVGMYVRLDRGAGAAGSSQPFIVPGGNIWTQLLVPIVDSPDVFQSYGAGTFEGVFVGIQNIQVALTTDQAEGLIGQTYTFGLDSVSIVPEPSSFAMLAGASFGALFYRKKKAS